MVEMIKLLLPFFAEFKSESMFLNRTTFGNVMKEKYRWHSQCIDQPQVLKSQNGNDNNRPMRKIADQSQ